MVKWKMPLEIIKDVRGTLIFYGWVICESLGSASMACYLLKKEKKYKEMKEIAQWAINELIEPYLEWIDYYKFMIAPMDIAYKLYCESQRKLFETYLKI